MSGAGIVSPWRMRTRPRTTTSLMPCLRAFIFEMTRPSGVFGPVDSIAFCRLASSFASDIELFNEFQTHTGATLPRGVSHDHEANDGKVFSLGYFPMRENKTAFGSGPGGEGLGITDSRWAIAGIGDLAGKAPRGERLAVNSTGLSVASGSRAEVGQQTERQPNLTRPPGQVGMAGWPARTAHFSRSWLTYTLTKSGSLLSEPDSLLRRTGGRRAKPEGDLAAGRSTTGGAPARRTRRLAQAQDVLAIGGEVLLARKRVFFSHQNQTKACLF